MPLPLTYCAKTTFRDHTDKNRDWSICKLVKITQLYIKFKKKSHAHSPLLAPPRCHRRSPPVLLGLRGPSAFDLCPHALLFLCDSVWSSLSPNELRTKTQQAFWDRSNQLPIEPGPRFLKLTFGLGALVRLLFLLLLTFLPFALVFLLDLLSHAGEDRLQHDGVFVDLKEQVERRWAPERNKLFHFHLNDAEPTRDPSKLKVWAFWHSSITSFSKSLRLRYLWLRILSWSTQENRENERWWERRKSRCFFISYRVQKQKTFFYISEDDC